MTNAAPFLPSAAEQADPPVIAERHGPASVPTFRINWGFTLGLLFCVVVDTSLFWILAWKLRGHS